MDYDDMYDDDAGITRREEQFGYIVGWNGSQYQIINCGAVVEECEDCWGEIGEKYTGFWRDPLEEIGTDFYRAIDAATELADESGKPTLAVSPDGERVFFEGGTCAVPMVMAEDPDELQDIVDEIGLRATVSGSPPFGDGKFSGFRIHRFKVATNRQIWAAFDHRQIEEYVATSTDVGWSYLVNHPFVANAIRMIYPIYIPPSFIHDESDRYNTYKGRVDNETREVMISPLTVDTLALMVAFGIVSRRRALLSIIGTLAHELAHLAEGQSGLTYDGKWTYMGGTIMSNVPSGSEVDAETVRGIVESDMAYSDQERMFDEVAEAVHFDSAVAALLDDPQIFEAYEAVGSSNALKWGTHYDIDGLTGYVAMEVLPAEIGIGGVPNAVEQLGLKYVYVNPMFGRRFDAVAFYDVEMIREDYLNNSAPED